jgi:hypothetical protein
MKRNMDLVREILLRCEENPGDFLTPGIYTVEQIRYHAAILIDAGFIDGRVLRGVSEIPVAVEVNSLTWKGHEFLDDVRSDTVWNQTKEKVGNQFQTMSIAVVQELAKSIVRAMMGL